MPDEGITGRTTTLPGGYRETSAIYRSQPLTKGVATMVALRYIRGYSALPR